MIKSLITNIIKYSFFVLLFIILVLNLFFQNLRPKATYINNIEYLIYGFIIFELVYWLFRFIEKKIKININLDKILFVFSIIFSIGLFCIARLYAFKTGWDSGTIIDTVILIINEDYSKILNEYFSKYPNNICMTLFFLVIYKISTIFNMNNGYYLLLGLNCLIYSFTGYIIYKISKRFFSSQITSLLVYIAYLVLVGISPWVIVPYSDNLALFLVSFGLYIFFKILECDNNKKTIFYICLLAVLSILGYFIKPQIFILYIAISVVYIFPIQKRKVINVSVFFTIFVIVYLIIQMIFSIAPFNLDNEKKIGISHYLMMGLNQETEGIFSTSDAEFSGSFDTVKERTYNNLKVAKNRIKESGIKGLASLAVKKSLINYNNATFAWYGEGEFFLGEYNKNNSNFAQSLKSFYYANGKNYIIFKTITQIFWITILFFAIFSFTKKEDSKLNVMKLALIGLTIFELIFEARARYLFSYVPIYVLIGIIGLNQFNSLLILVLKKFKQFIFKNKLKYIDDIAK